MFNWSYFPNSKMARLFIRSEVLRLTGQGLLRFIELRTFRSVTGRVLIANMFRQMDT